MNAHDVIPDFTSAIQIETKISVVSVSNIFLKQNNMLEQNEPVIVALTLYKKYHCTKLSSVNSHFDRTLFSCSSSCENFLDGSMVLVYGYA